MGMSFRCPLLLEALLDGQAAWGPWVELRSNTPASGYLSFLLASSSMRSRSLFSPNRNEARP